MTYRNRKIERIALDFLSTLPSHMHQFPFDISGAIATMKHCSVHTYQNFAVKHMCSVEDVIDFCESETGATHNIDNNYIIMFNDELNTIEERKLFTLAHELGHILSGHLNKYGYSRLAYKEINQPILEREANYFAACLLCPIPIIYQLKPKSPNDIKEIFNISVEASKIAWSDYINYNRNYFLSWHNDMIGLYL